MSDPEKSFQAAHEIGRIYDAITDRKVLIDFFLTTVSRFIPSENGYLFLAGKNGDLWLDAAMLQEKELTPDFFNEAQKIFESGKPIANGKRLFLPVIARNSALG